MSIISFRSRPRKIDCAVGTVLVLGGVNIRRHKGRSEFLKALTVLKGGHAGCLSCYFGFIGGRGNFSNFSPFFASPPDPFEALAGGMVGAFFAFAGWWEVSRIAGEVNDAEKNLPKALAIGVIMLTVIYILTSAVFMYLVPAANVTSDETFAAQAGEALFGAAGG